jgi:hypothetical protein
MFFSHEIYTFLAVTKILLFPSSASSQAKRSLVFQSELQSETYNAPLNTNDAKRQKKVQLQYIILRPSNNIQLINVTHTTSLIIHLKMETNKTKKLTLHMV